MKIILSVLFFYLLLLQLKAKMDINEIHSIDIIHYDFSISVSDTNNIIYGHTEITVNFIGTVNTS